MSFNRTLGFIVAVCALAALVAGVDDAAAQVPAAPSGIEIIVVGENALDITWVDNSDNEAAFDIFRQDGAGPSRSVGAVEANLTLFQDRASGIVPNVQYCYVVYARNSAGRSDPSDEECVVIPPRPASPSGLIVSRSNDDSPINLTWIDNSTNETGFLIYRDTRGTGFILQDTVEASVSRYDDLAVRSEGQYCYFVSAFNVSGESQGSNQACLDVTVGDPTLPTSFEVKTIEGTSAELNWTFGFVSHSTLAIERSVGSEGPWTQIYETPQLETSYVDSDLASNTEFCYRLVLESASGVSAITDPECTRTEFTVPPTPTAVDASGLDGRIRVTWSLEPSPDVLFRVERRIGLGSFELVVDSLDAFQFTDLGLSEQEIYCYRVQSFNPQFESPVSAIACAILAPAPVTNLRVAPGVSSPTHSLNASWTQGPGTPATSFEVSYRPVGEDEFSTPAVTNGLSYLITDLDDAVEYEVQVVSFRAQDSLSAQSEGVVASGSTLLSVWPGDMDDDGSVTASDAVVLTSPQCFGMTTGLSSDGLDVSWKERAVDASGADPLVLRCDADQTGTVDIFDFLAIAANAGRQVSKAIASTPTEDVQIRSESHLKRLYQIYEHFEPERGNVAQERLKIDLARILQKAGSEIVPDRLAIGRLYPNPVIGKATVGIDLPSDSNIRLSVVTVTGQEVKVVANERRAAGRHQLTLNTGGLAGGIYFLVLEADRAVVTRPIVVVR